MRSFSEATDLMAAFGPESYAFEVADPVPGVARRVIASLSTGGATLRVVASVGDGWDYVSVSRFGDGPSKEDMELLKRLFFLPHEVAVVSESTSNDPQVKCLSRLHAGRDHAPEHAEPVAR